MSEEKINKGYYFELMYRCHVQMESIGLFLLGNPHIEAIEEHRKKLEAAQDLIMDVYQWAGWMDREEEKTNEQCK